MTEEEVTAHRAYRKRLYLIAIVFVSMFAIVATNIIYTTIAIRRSEQSWCELVTGLDNQNQRTPPPSVNGKVFARNIHTLRTKYHCK